jgi:hypothetical protein
MASVQGDVVASGRFERAIRRIDEANAADPAVLVVNGEPRPKELAHAEMVTEWVRRLRPEAGEALLLAARAHHIKRWHSQRSSYPKGRKGYLRWRSGLHEFHAREAGAILEECGYDADTIARVQQIIRKHGLGRDPDVQALEDALCLVFLDTQLSAVIEALPEETMADVARKTWRKMSPAAREQALALDLRPAGRGLVAKALSGK